MAYSIGCRFWIVMALGLGISMCPAWLLASPSEALGIPIETSMLTCNSGTGTSSTHDAVRAVCSDALALGSSHCAPVTGSVARSPDMTQVITSNRIATRVHQPRRDMIPRSDANPDLRFDHIHGDSFHPERRQFAQPGRTVLYPHTYRTRTAGTVEFTLKSGAFREMRNWRHALYHDRNCNGAIDSYEDLFSDHLRMKTREALCLLVAIEIPESAPYGTQHRLQVAANFREDAAPFHVTHSLSRRDVTIVGPELTVSGAKWVDDEIARAGEVETYTLMSVNPGSQAITGFMIEDATPAGSTFLGASCQLPLPIGLTACTVTSQPPVGAAGALRWKVTGTLSPGRSVAVQFQVRKHQHAVGY